jgi:hypothetical protein
MVFDTFRQALEDWMNRATPPEERRALASRMRDTLVQAKAGLDDLRDGLATMRQRLDAEQRELDTIRRRKQLAEGIGDRETVSVAAAYEEVHAKRVEIVSQKVAAQEAELALAEREVETMSAQLKSALSEPGEEIEALGRERARADREADATRRLEELKRRMGK